MPSVGKTHIRGWLLTLLFMLASLPAWAQTGSIKGVMKDEAGEGLISGRVFILGTSKGALTDYDGNFEIGDLKPGDYQVQFSFPGLAQQEITLTVEAGKATEVNLVMIEYSVDEVVIHDQALIDLDDPKSGVELGEDYIDGANARTTEELLSMQVGVSQNPDGLSIRGGRVYETTQLMEGVQSSDPLAGTGSGVRISANAISSLDLTTGGGGAEYGNGTAGVINTRIREGGNRWRVRGSWTRDNLGFDRDWSTSWNTDRVSLSAGGPLITRGDSSSKRRSNILSLFTAADVGLTDTYFGAQANQLHSSLLPSNDSLWAPRQDNQFSHTIKLSWNITPMYKISLTNQHSLNINQNSRTLQIVGNDAILTPGFPYAYSLNLNNANTYTHHSNLTVLNFTGLVDTFWTVNATVGRLFTNLRADANGRPFRTNTVDQIYDPASIVTDPVSVYNPGDSVVYVFPGPGLYNNDGIGTLWHDHYAQEYTIKYKFIHQSRNQVHLLSFGHEHKEQEFQWIDVQRPWIGAPIQIDDTTSTPSTSIGSSSDYWLVRPSQGGFFFQDEIRYKGIIANLGLRFDYWAPGKFADEAVENPEAPVVDEVREQYMEQTTGLFGKRWKARLLPKLRVAFPVTDNNMLYFNYGHSTRLPHPRFVYAGLDPVYQDRGFLSNLGNPNINPEVTVSYEVGLKSMINKDLALTATAFYNDKFDYIVSRRIIIQDQTGRFVEKTFYINQDYARIRGVEVSLTQRVKDVFKVFVSGAYQIATGKSNTAAESALQIKNQGFVSTSKERYLAWDRPFDLKLALFYDATDSSMLGPIPLKNFHVFLSSTFKSGLRYTPYELTGIDPNSGRPQYEAVDDNPYGKIAAPWFWTDLVVSRDFTFGKKTEARATLSIEVKNLFNNRNSQIINGVTGKAYREGDPVPLTWRDPSYPDPQDNGLPPLNPARYLQPRQLLYGIKFSF